MIIAWGMAGMGYSHGNPSSAGARYARKRKERLAASPERHTKEQWERLKLAFEYRCSCCGVREVHHCLCCGSTTELHCPPWQQQAEYMIGDIKLFRDHIVPVACGGHDGISNIQPCCYDCNRSKGTKTIDYRPDHIKKLVERGRI